MLPEYDFSGKKGIRDKYSTAYQQGHTVRIHKYSSKSMNDSHWNMPPNKAKALMLAKRQLSELVCDAINLEGIQLYAARSANPARRHNRWWS